MACKSLLGSHLGGRQGGHRGGGGRAVVLLALSVACHCIAGIRDVGIIGGSHGNCLVHLRVPRLRGGAEDEGMKGGKEDGGFIRGGARSFEVEIKRFIPGEPLNSEPSRPRIPPSPASLLRGDPQEIARWERRRRRLGRGPAKDARAAGKGRIFSHYHEIDRILCRRLRFSSLETEAETGAQESVGTEGRKGAASAEDGASGISTNRQCSDAGHGGDQGGFRSGGQRRRERMLDLAERAMAASQEADALPAEALGGESQVERKVEERKPKGRVKPWLIPRYGASGETEEDAIRAAIRKAMPGIAARDGYNETQLQELKSQALGSERVAIPKPITAEKYDTAMKSQRDWERRQREDNEANEGRGKHREGVGKDPELDHIMKSFDDLRDVTERRVRERSKRPRR